jgi:porin
MDEADSPGIAGNPGAVDVQPGTGALGRLLGLDPSTGFRLGGVLVSNGNYLVSGGNNPGRASFNNLLVIDLGVDLDKPRVFRARRSARRCSASTGSRPTSRPA